ncbi:hypothetical protein OH76DRAFT_1414794 [Lentinus brumalis]|uniref:Uncharacterized protein n=1 Tax=Lentinus brumalis TaxID=2498619 RepID=A0A371DSE6_9APHY|nr:hypothetical protein OH76DRAFT_1414794 [Polyporus brumalis]
MRARRSRAVPWGCVALLSMAASVGADNLTPRARPDVYRILEEDVMVVGEGSGADGDCLARTDADVRNTLPYAPSTETTPEQGRMQSRTDEVTQVSMLQGPRDPEVRRGIDLRPSGRDAHAHVWVRLRVPGLRVARLTASIVLVLVSQCERESTLEGLYNIGATGHDMS